MQEINWKSERRKVSELKPAEYNPRKANEKQYKDLEKSIEKFNLADPIIINKNNTVIGGHFRLKVLKKKGVSEVDVRVSDRELTEQEEKELNIRLNKNLGEWDFDLLENFDSDILKEAGFNNLFEHVDIQKEWEGMPEFNQNNINPYMSINVNFLKKEDYRKFAELISQNLTEQTKIIWYPKQDFDSCGRDLIYTDKT